MIKSTKVAEQIKRHWRHSICEAMSGLPFFETLTEKEQEGLYLKIREDLEKNREWESKVYFGFPNLVCEMALAILGK